MTTIGVSLKMYFGHARAREWLAAVAAIARSEPAVAGGRVELFVAPSFLAIGEAVRILRDTPVEVAAQDLATDDSGAFTGEVSGAELAELGCALVEVGHAERRRLYGESDEMVARKTAAALRNGLTPVLCVGEAEAGAPGAAIEECSRQLRSALTDAPPGRVVVAYEPVWAIGAREPADPGRIRAVCSQLAPELARTPGREGSSVIYGGSAGPGLLAALGTAVDGLFLGRFAHDPDALRRVIWEAAAGEAAA